MEERPTSSLSVIANLRLLHHFSLTGLAETQSLVTCSIAKSAGNCHSHALLVGGYILSMGNHDNMHLSYKGLDRLLQQFILNILPQMIFQNDIPGLILGEPLEFRSKSGF